ncbi:hypothetical protein BTO04_00830 [Polaribacter sp. SA4-10]|uniref:hypothetical protein n=1 Tax=Polaribacter sp. SA4-10 TaxID=754397 RepID=UPI000B3C2988|nr:hypothetical protein [Polaribacter sp. SA4-10]ARV05322.1 hypothetical protein BTO04_00830 [Polaribacter sp. SA4-10]
MKNKEYINQQVEGTFKVLDTIEKVDVNHFFKHKVLQKLQEKEAYKITFSWLSPQLQLATLGMVVFLNVSAILYAFSINTTDTSLETFAQEYSLYTETNSILN